MSDGMRLFVGAPVSMKTVETLASGARALKGAFDDVGLRARWVPPANYHITLKFLGWTRNEAFDAVRDRLAATLAGTSPLSFSCSGFGAFPRPDTARILWAGVSEPTGALNDLAGHIDRAMTDLGYPEEKRPFHPHVTIARIAKSAASVRDLLEPFSERRFSKTDLESVVLFESITKSSGSQYVERARFVLEPASKSGKRQTQRIERTHCGEEEGNEEHDSHGQQ